MSLPHHSIPVRPIILLHFKKLLQSVLVAVIRVSVRENFPIGDTVMTLSAYDPDGSSDGEVTYEYEGNATVSFYMFIKMIENILILQNLFNINQLTGMMIVATSLDREISDNIVFDVRASDQGSPMLYRYVVTALTHNAMTLCIQ